MRCNRADVPFVRVKLSFEISLSFLMAMVTFGTFELVGKCRELCNELDLYK